MRKKLAVLLFGVVLTSTISLTGCNGTAAREWGGSITLELPANQKLEEITWKEDSLWYLTRPMTEDDIAETHTFQEQSNFGVLEGTVTIIEKKED